MVVSQLQYEDIWTKQVSSVHAGECHQACHHLGHSALPLPILSPACCLITLCWRENLFLLFSISLFNIHEAVFFPPKSPIIMAALLLFLRKRKRSVFVRELGKKSGIENLSTARLQHDEVWTQSDSALNYGKQWLCRMKVPSQPTAARSTCLKEFQQGVWLNLHSSTLLLQPPVACVRLHLVVFRASPLSAVYMSQETHTCITKIGI